MNSENTKTVLLKIASGLSYVTFIISRITAHISEGEPLFVIDWELMLIIVPIIINLVFYLFVRANSLVSTLPNSIAKFLLPAVAIAVAIVVDLVVCDKYGLNSILDSAQTDNTDFLISLGLLIIPTSALTLVYHFVGIIEEDNILLNFFLAYCTQCVIFGLINGFYFIYNGNFIPINSKLDLIIFVFSGLLCSALMTIVVFFAFLLLPIISIST
jgi:hypothetical protein